MLSYRNVLSGIFSLVMLAASATAQPFDIARSQIDISVIAGVNHLPLRLPITHDTSTSVSSLSVSSDAGWVTPQIDVNAEELELVFTTSGLIARSQTATITVANSEHSDTIFVTATVSAMNIVALEDDPVRSRTYGVDQDGIETGSIVVFDPLHDTVLGNLTVGKKPGDLAVRSDGSELLVISSVSKNIDVIDLNTLEISATIDLPVFDDSGSADTSANIAIGTGDIVYYVDGAWAPMLHVLDLGSGNVIQSLGIDGTSYGFGDIVVNSVANRLFGWAQYGWTAGTSSSFAVSFDIEADGTLTPSEQTSSQYPTTLSRNPLNTPALMSSDGTLLILKQIAFDPDSLATTVASFPSPIYSISPNAEVAITNDAIYEADSGNQLYPLPTQSTVQCITNDYARLVYFDASEKDLKTLNLVEAVGSAVLGRELSPADGGIVQSPATLSWSAVPGAEHFRVYLGTSLSAVEGADTSSAEFIGEVSVPTIDLSTDLTTGTTYFWRVDSVVGGEENPGAIWSFVVSNIASSLTVIEGDTVRGHANFTVPVELTSDAAGAAWAASASESWVGFGQTSGSTPATLEVVLDASNLESGVHRATISISTDGGAFDLPVSLVVDPLAVTILKSDPTSSKVYAISEDITADVDRAYLLEIDTESEKIERVTRVGSSVTDLAIHHGDNRIYVPNWRGGSLLAINLDTFALERTYAFAPFGGVGYSEGDVYRVAAGIAGRLIVEEEDQWIDVSLFDTAAGTVLDTTFEREGGGVYSPDGRYYYHGDNNSSGATIHKLDTVGDTFSSLGEKRVESASYYGSRVIVISEDGTKVFWNGSMFDASLNVLWTFGDHVYATSADGRYAFCEDVIRDTEAKEVIFNMPRTTQVCAFNSTTKRLVLQQESTFGFYVVDPDAPVPPPVLSVAATTHDSATLAWSEESLNNGYTLQYREVGGADWVDVTPGPEAGTATHTVPGLAELTGYEFRIKANTSHSSTDWSNVVSATTPITPPNVPSFDYSSSESYAFTVRWRVNGDFDAVVIEFSLADTDDWAVIATVEAGTLEYYHTGLSPSTRYSYRLKSTRDGVESDYSNINTIQTQPPPTLPVINIQPSDTVVQAGANASFGISVSGSSPMSYQWQRNGASIAGATGSYFSIQAATFAEAGDYSVVVTNPAGSVTSSVATLTVEPTPFSGTYFGSLAASNGYWALNVREDATARFLVFVKDPRCATVIDLTVSADGRFSGTGTLHTQPLIGSAKDSTIAPMTVPTTTVNGWISSGVVSGSLSGLSIWFSGFVEPPSGSSVDIAGIYQAAALGTNAGWIHSIVGTNGQMLTVVFTSQLVDGALGAISSGGTFSVEGAFATSLSGAVDTSASGITASVTPNGGTAIDFVTELPAGMRTDRLVNISSRGSPGSGDSVMIAGFVVGGTEPRTLLLRGAGPAMIPLGVPTASKDSYLEIYDSNGTKIAENDDWQTATNATQVALSFDHVGAFKFADGSADAALLLELSPGAYTAISRGKAGAEGVVLTEVYDVTSIDEETRGVVNLSIRTRSGTGDDVAIAGFVVSGNAPKRVLIRAVGPGLTEFGISADSVLTDPVMSLFEDSNPIVSNDDWSVGGDEAEVESAAAQVGAFSLDSGSKDSAILTTLLPGTYTAVVQGNNGSTGIVLIEVYQVE